MIRRLFHRHDWKLVGISKHPHVFLSIFLFYCDCGKFRDEQHIGHWYFSVSDEQAADVEVQELRKISGLGESA